MTMSWGMKTRKLDLEMSLDFPVWSIVKAIYRDADFNCSLEHYAFCSIFYNTIGC